MEIRIATVNDKENLGLFYEKEVDYLLSHINYPFWDKFYPSKITVADNIDKGWQYLCIDAGKIIGAFVLNTDPQGDYGQGNWQINLKEGEYYVIHTFCTASECYKRGIGTYMIDFIKEKARREGKKGLRLDTVTSNIPAQKLYEKNGFSYVGSGDLARGLEFIPSFSLFEFNF